METPIFLDPNNPFIRKTLERRLGRAGVSPDVKPGQGNEAIKGLLDKHKWKMLRRMPGAHSGNTWSAMKLLNQGLKQGGFGTSGQQSSKPTLVQSAVRKPLEWGFGKENVDNAAVGLEYFSKNKDDILESAELLRQNKDRIKQVSGYLNKFDQYKDYLDPEKWKGFLSQGVGSLSKLIGGGGSGILALLQMLYNGMTGWGQNNPKTTAYMDPLTGSGYAAQQHLDRMRREDGLHQIAQTLQQRERKMAELKTVDWLDIALQGSKQFHQKKAASGDGTISPDVITKGYTALSGALKNVSARARRHDTNNPYSPLLDKTAEYIGQGFPGEVACVMASGGNEKIAEQVAPFLYACAQDILCACVNESYAHKVAEYKKAKAAHMAATKAAAQPSALSTTAAVKAAAAAILAAKK